MKKILFLLTSLLGVAGIANAQVDFNLTTPADLATNTLSIDEATDATTQEFTVAYGTETIDFVTAELANVKVVDATYSPICGVTSVDKKVGSKNVFTVTLDATGLAAKTPILLAFPQGAFKAATSTSVNKKFGVHLNVCKVATFEVTGNNPEKGTWTQSTKTWNIPAEFVTPTELTGKITSTPAGFTKVGTMPAGLTLNADGTFKIAKGTTSYAATYVIPAKALKVKNTNGSYSYSSEITLNVTTYTQAVNMTVKDATTTAAYNSTKEVSTKTDDIRLQFYKGVVAAENELNNIDRADLTEFTITGKANDGTEVNITIPGSEFAYTSTDVNKTFTHALGQKLHAGSYTACMHFNTTNMKIAGVDKIRYEYVYTVFDVYQIAETAKAAITNANALDGEDIYITVDGLQMNIKNLANVIKLGTKFDAVKNKTFAGNYDVTPVTPYVTNSAGVKTNIVDLTWNEATSTYTIKLENKVDAGKGYILTFPINSIFITDAEKYYSNQNLVAVELDIYHGFEFKDVEAAQTTAATTLVSDTYDRLHFTRLSTNGNLAASVLPFDVKTADVPEMEFYQITAAAVEDGNTKLYINKVNGTVKAWQPYMVKVNGDVKNKILEGYKVLATVPTGAGSVKSATVFDEYTFHSSADGKLVGLLPSDAKVDYLLMGSEGGLNTLTESQRKAYNGELLPAQNKTIHPWRFYVVCNHAYGVDNGVDYSKVIIVEDEETTGINTVNAQAENGAMFNVAGQRISAPVKGQVYIMNGKKYIAK